jgi:hypothetical protein
VHEKVKHDSSTVRIFTTGTPCVLLKCCLCCGHTSPARRDGNVPLLQVYLVQVNRSRPPINSAPPPDRPCACLNKQAPTVNANPADRHCFVVLCTSMDGCFVGAAALATHVPPACPCAR